jgi:hypothetical protein
VDHAHWKLKRIGDSILGRARNERNVGKEVNGVKWRIGSGGDGHTPMLE